MQKEIVAQKKRLNKADENTARILVVDDHPVLRQGLTDLINQEKNLVVCGEAADAAEAMEAIKTLEPDMVTVDISLKEVSGMELIKDINIRCPGLPILVISMHEEALYAERALRAGAKGYITKQEARKKVVTAIRKVLSGQLYLSDASASLLVRKLVHDEPELTASGMGCLTDRELEVFTLLGKAKSTSQIAKQLHLSTKTVETYRERIKEKLNLANSTELLFSAFNWVNEQDKR